MRLVAPAVFALSCVVLVGCGSTNSVAPASAVLNVSTGSYDFGPDVVGQPITRTVTTVTNSSAAMVTLRTTLMGDASFALAAASEGGCGVQLAAGDTCELKVAYLPKAAAANTATVQVSTVTTGQPLIVTLTGQSATLTSGTVTATVNPHVAQYTINSPFPATLSVAFGPTTAYGRMTGVVATTGGSSSVTVAGMAANSTVHLEATLTFANGVQVTDGDHTFTTGSSLPGIPASFPVVTSGVKAPQPGIELMDPLIFGTPSTALATDLAGNVIWAYPFADRGAGDQLYPVKPLANGDFLCFITPASYPPGAAATLDVMREFDLVGNTVRELTVATLNEQLAAAGFNLTLNVLSHDFAVLPNSHVLVVANTVRNETGLVGFPGTLAVTGDVVIDLDPTWKPVWVWNEFDHFDVNRHPFSFPDWTHTNSIAYSAGDGSFMVSIRHQNWIVKVDYNNGAGAGDVLWRLGEGGDFKLVGGTDPTDWFYAQHDAKFASATTVGAYPITVMDNGDDREFPAGVACGTSGAPPCLYTTVEELQIDETAKTATLLFHQILPTNLYSNFAGNAEVLANGDFEYALAGANADTATTILEVTPGATPATVWEMTTPSVLVYRGFRVPSLYPGVQW